MPWSNLFGRNDHEMIAKNSHTLPLLILDKIPAMIKSGTLIACNKWRPKRFNYPKTSKGINHDRLLLPQNQRKRSTGAALHTASSSLSSHPLGESGWVPCLQEDGPGTGKFAHEPFSGCHTGNNTPRGDALKDVLRIPRNEMAVIDNISLAFLELLLCQHASHDGGMVENSHLSG